jgi:hypothetical protein
MLRQHRWNPGRLRQTVVRQIPVLSGLTATILRASRVVVLHVEAGRRGQDAGSQVLAHRRVPRGATARVLRAAPTACWAGRPGLLLGHVRKTRGLGSSRGRRADRSRSDQRLYAAEARPHGLLATWRFQVASDVEPRRLDDGDVVGVLSHTTSQDGAEVRIRRARRLQSWAHQASTERDCIGEIVPWSAGFQAATGIGASGPQFAALLARTVRQCSFCGRQHCLGIWVGCRRRSNDASVAGGVVEWQQMSVHRSLLALSQLFETCPILQSHCAMQASIRRRSPGPGSSRASRRRNTKLP